MATIKEVAQLANVSVATVSRVLNGSPSVKQKSAEKVLKAVHELNYSPNLAARNLRRNESRSILVFIPQLTNPYYYNILAGISDKARMLDYSAYICSLEHNPQQEEIIMHTIQNKRADGIIFLFCNQDDLWLNKYAGSFPMIFCSEYVEGLDIPYIGINNRQAAYDAVKYLTSIGHKKIGMISSQNSYISTRLRYQGYCQALNDAGLSFRRDYIAYASSDYSFESGSICAQKLLTLPDPPTALFCISDRLAFGALAAATELKISVPNQLSIWGFDNLEYTSMIHPYLSTVSQPSYEIGKTGMEILNRCMTSDGISDKFTILPHELIIRESSGSPK